MSIYADLQVALMRDQQMIDAVGHRDREGPEGVKGVHLAHLMWGTGTAHRLRTVPLIAGVNFGGT